MKSFTPYIIAAVVAAYLGLSFVSQEYAHIRSAIGETKAKTDAVADETKATMEAIKQTIEDLRAKFMTLETQLAAGNPPKQVEQTKQTKPTIVMHSASWCGPCQRWKRDAMQQWTAAGWAIEVIEDDATKESVPWYDITDGDGVRFKSVGYLTKETFERDKALAERQGATIE